MPLRHDLIYGGNDGCRARANTVADTDHSNTSSSKTFCSDQKAIWTAPFHLERSDTKWVVPSGIGVMALFTTDRITGDEMFEANRQVNAVDGSVMPARFTASARSQRLSI